MNRLVVLCKPLSEVRVKRQNRTRALPAALLLLEFEGRRVYRAGLEVFVACLLNLALGIHPPSLDLRDHLLILLGLGVRALALR